MMKKKLFKRKSKSKKVTPYLPILTFLVVVGMYYFSIIYSPKWNFKWEGIRKEIKDSIIALDDYGEITSYAVGYSGHTPQQYHRQNWLLKNTTVSEFKKLIEYPSGVVKGIAYEGLLRNLEVKKYPLFKKSLNDTLTFVFYASGCSSDGFMLSDYVINFISRLSKEVPPSPNSPKMEITDKEKTEILALLEERKTKEKYYKKEFFKVLK